ncbi:MAG: hypothetical protein K0S08_2125 [Gammaproteobacteria bacterium]|nr:hypothetical protein [Gammaproteobacteria bacterium]
MSRCFRLLAVAITFTFLLCSFSSAVFAHTLLWTAQGARLELVKNNPGSNINWVLLPGGPGLGSVYLEPLATSLKVPGNVWLLDLPGDGDNRLNGKSINYDAWPQDIVDVVSTMSNVVLIAHSAGGMFALMAPQLEYHLKGLVLLDSSPNNHFLNNLPELSKSFKLPNVAELRATYMKNKNDKTFKWLMVNLADYFYPLNESILGKSQMQNLAYNHLPYDWFGEKFFPKYQATWVPAKVPVLIVAGSKDILTPISTFKTDARFYRKNIKFVVIKNAAHFSWISHENRLNEILQNFFLSAKTG